MVGMKATDPTGGGRRLITCHERGFVVVLRYSDRRNSSGSLAMLAAMRRASSRVSRFGRRAVRRSATPEIGGEAEVRGLRLKR